MKITANISSLGGCNFWRVIPYVIYHPAVCFALKKQNQFFSFNKLLYSSSPLLEFLIINFVTFLKTIISVEERKIQIFIYNFINSGLISLTDLKHVFLKLPLVLIKTILIDDSFKIIFLVSGKTSCRISLRKNSSVYAKHNRFCMKNTMNKTKKIKSRILTLPKNISGLSKYEVFLFGMQKIFVLYFFLCLPLPTFLKK